jgi:hypothetical protein
MELKHGDEITFNGTRFVVEVTQEKYYKLIPLDDECWLLRWLERIAPRSTDENSSL